MSILEGSQHLFIPFEDIVAGTNNFQDCIGKGGYGDVYKGQLVISGESMVVAVKRLNERFGQGLKEFLMEIQMLTGQTHRNIINLVGYCDDGKENILVYEFAEHGSLDQLIRRSTNTSFSWLLKLKICVDAAKGLYHLHNHVGQHQTIIHRDVKSSNILLDKNWVAKISDFGLAKLTPQGLDQTTMVVSNVCGTRGYCDPNYLQTGVVQRESDVYSFGVVLFEVLCGKLCNIREDDGFLFSGSLVKDYYEKNKLDDIVDPGLKGQMNPESNKIFTTIAYKCLHDDRGQRPTMAIVLKELEQSFEFQLSYVWESSYATEDPSKSSWELGAQDSKRSTTESLEPPVIVSSNDSQLKIIVEDKSSVGLQSSFDITTQTQPTVDMDVGNVEPLSPTLILSSTNSMWIDQPSYGFVRKYFELEQQALEVCSMTEKCLKRLQGIRMLVLVALRYFHEKRYEKTLEILRDCKAVGDPFTEDFIKSFDYVDRKQKGFVVKLIPIHVILEKRIKQLQNQWVVGCGSLCCLFAMIVYAFAAIVVLSETNLSPWTISLPIALCLIIFVFICVLQMTYKSKKSRISSMKEEKELINSLQVNSLHTIKVHVNKVDREIKDLITKIGDVKMVNAYGSEIIQEIKRKHDLFVESVQRLEMEADNYNRQIQRARTVALQTFYKRAVQKISMEVCHAYQEAQGRLVG